MFPDEIGDELSVTHDWKVGWFENEVEQYENQHSASE